MIFAYILVFLIGCLALGLCLYRTPQYDPHRCPWGVGDVCETPCSRKPPCEVHS